jgi:hypothetical protein
MMIISQIIIIGPSDIYLASTVEANLPRDKVNGTINKDVKRKRKCRITQTYLTLSKTKVQIV